MRTKAEFFEIVDEHTAHLQMGYQRFADKNPIMQISLPSRLIYAYPYSEFLKTLSHRSQKMLQAEYRAARKENKMVVFVRDDETKVLKSASFPIDKLEVT